MIICLCKPEKTSQNILSTSHATFAADIEFHTCGLHYPATKDKTKVCNTDL